jgi:hypothetical protein
VTESDVDRVIQRDFAPDEAAEVESILRDVDGASPRVLLAALKLAARDVAALRRALEMARLDARDVIASAEYPIYMSEVSPGGSLTEARLSEIIRSDQAQYCAWFERE